MSLSDRIKQLIDKKGVTPYVVSKATGISDATFSRVLNNSTAKLNETNLSKLANYFNVEIDWLRTGAGDENIRYDVEANPQPHDVMSRDQMITELLWQNRKLIDVIDKHATTIANLSKGSGEDGKDLKKAHGKAS
jgi:transcriptional regulator with XRE-family HTH domain